MRAALAAPEEQVQLFALKKPVFGVVHLPPLPGAPGYRGPMSRVIARSVSDAETLLKGGMDGLLVENFGDAPFFAGPVPPETLAAMTAATVAVRGLGRFPLGVNVLRNDAEGALAVAAAVEAQFIRVNVLAGTAFTDQGAIMGRAAQTLRLRRSLGIRCAIWADVLVKHAHPPVALDAVEVARDLRDRALADALIVTGPRTGAPADAGELRRLRRALPGAAWVVGSGIRAESLHEFWDLADAFVVGTSLHRRGRLDAAIDPARVRELVQRRRALLA